MAEHHLKTLAEYYDAVASGAKTFELRKNDRAFAVDDMLVLHRIPADDRPQKLHKRVTYVLLGGQYGLDPDYAILGLGEPS